MSNLAQNFSKADFYTIIITGLITIECKIFLSDIPSETVIQYDLLDFYNFFENIKKLRQYIYLLNNKNY